MKVASYCSNIKLVPVVRSPEIVSLAKVPRESATRDPFLKSRVDIYFSSHFVFQEHVNNSKIFGYKVKDHRDHLILGITTWFLKSVRPIKLRSISKTPTMI